MRQFGQRVTGWCAVFLAFLLPLKFGSLSLMPEQPPMFPADLISLLVIFQLSSSEFGFPETAQQFVYKPKN